ncbi:MAG: hypothetical protein LBP59_11095 [Planctomycetaceae bacterium]|jgi:hypothetical protein|nr:hypothetical protein [Planctomycetaceae bacterium]
MIKLKFPLYAAPDINLPKGKIHDGQMLNETGAAFDDNIIERFRIVINLTKQLDIALNFYYAVDQLFIFDLVNAYELRCPIAFDNEHAREYYTMFNERYARYHSWCLWRDPNRNLMIPVTYRLCLRFDDIIELFDKCDSILIRDMRSYFVRSQIDDGFVVMKNECANLHREELI